MKSLAEAGPKLGNAALGIGAISLAILAFGAATVAATAMIGGAKLASYLGSLMGMGDISVLDQIFALADNSERLLVVANSLMTIADAIERIGSAFSSFAADPEIALETIDTLVSMDATKIQTLQDVSLALERVTNANEQLRGENQAEKMGAAIGGGMGSAGGNAAVVNTTNIGSTNMIMPHPSGRNTDPSILFSGERYYSMIYR
jgi:hypothetical protein